MTSKCRAGHRGPFVRGDDDLNQCYGKPQTYDPKGLAGHGSPVAVNDGRLFHNEEPEVHAPMRSVALDIRDYPEQPPRPAVPSRKKKRTTRKQKKENIGKKQYDGKPKTYAPSLPEPKRDEDPSCSSRFWRPFTSACTFLIPDFLICCPGKEAKQAWREKVTIFMIMILSNVVFLGVFAVIPLYFCRDTTPLSKYEWYENVLEPTCSALNIAMFALLFAFAGLLVLQCLCSLALGLSSLLIRMRKSPPEENQEAAVMVMVPCYNEGEGELRKTIQSILMTDYPDENKVMMVVADGIITGRGEWMNTPRHLAKILGFEVSKRDKGYAYNASGENRASVYSGTYECSGKSLKYIVVVKRGLPSEKESAKPGNRGKRDSQLIALGLFNRVHHDRRLSELDNAVCSALNDLRVPSTDLEYLLAIDADTRISQASISHMVHCMEKNKKILACCGETKVDNKSQSWVTMIQVFEYFASHHLKKSFESVFGCVTCLPGCFTMYRMYSEDWRPLIAADNILQPYSRNDINSLHEKNLYHLGEDRMLTTLLLKYFPDMKLSFVPIAACWTIVPNEFKVLLSQRRRWINSTFHNMWELLRVNTLCGCCCISMKAVVALDMISTMILPGAFMYAVSFIYTVFLKGEGVSLVTLILYGVILGVQVLIFLVRSRLDYLWWFLVYLVFGMPVFFFILPLYSFWYMDDLSWGTTRQVKEKSKK